MSLWRHDAPFISGVCWSHSRWAVPPLFTQTNTYSFTKNILKILYNYQHLTFNSSIECCRVHCKSTNLCCWCAISASWMAAWHHASYSLSVEFCCFPFIYLLLWAFLFSPAVVHHSSRLFFFSVPLVSVSAWAPLFVYTASQSSFTPLILPFVWCYVVTTLVY